MPFEVCWADKGVVWNYSGDVTSDDIRESNDRVYGDPRFDALRWELANFLKADGVSFTSRDVRIIAGMDRAASITNPLIRVAFVADSPRVLELLSEYRATCRNIPWQMAIFTSIEEAMTFLEVQAGQLTCLHSVVS